MSAPMTAEIVKALLAHMKIHSTPIVGCQTCAAIIRLGREYRQARQG